MVWMLAWAIIAVTVVSLFGWLLYKHGPKDGASIASPLATALLGLSVLFLAFHQADQSNRQAATEKTANWAQFHGACLEMFEILDSKSPRGIEAFEPLAADRKSQKFVELRQIIVQQLANPVLIQDKECLGYWRNMNSTAWTAIRLLEEAPESPAMHGQIQQMFSGILGDLTHVWKKLVLNSGEISATGGRPRS